MFNEISFSPFYKSFLSLCSQKGVTPSVAARDAGISSGAPTAWKRGAIPKPAQREKLCDYFGVTDEVLLGYDIEKVPTSDGGHSEDRDIRRIERAKNRMSKEEWNHQMKIIEASFGDYFSDDYEEDDLDE